MIKQQSFKDVRPTLYIVATPIGNLQEMTPRAIDILKTVDVIAAEDTRDSKKLMQAFDIDTPMISYHEHNERNSSKGILALLEQGKHVALISDAGYPLISDPGQTVVKDALDHDYSVVPISGSSAFLNALVASGIVVQPFLFLGFLEAKEGRIKAQLEAVQELPYTLIFYVSVHKVERTLEVIQEVLGNRRIALARELTKRHEEFIRGTIQEVRDSMETIKGEYVLVIEGNETVTHVTIESLMDLIDEEISKGTSVSRAISHIAKTHQYSKNELYSAYQNRRQ